jgi:[histone H3]-lysine36 N-trimethyltransferase
MECMTAWPLLQRNKVEDSKVSIPVEACAKSENETCKTLAEKVSS